jgi:hypothetical protein
MAYFVLVLPGVRLNDCSKAHKLSKQNTQEMKQCILFLLCMRLFYTVEAQSIACRIVDGSTNEGIPFVNIGVVGKNIGTVSDEEGNFQLQIPKSNLLPQDTLRISAIGYETVSVLIKDIESVPRTIKMKKIIFSLPGVTINPNSHKNTKELGHSLESDKIVFYFLSNKLGTELATLIKVKKGKMYLKKAHFNISVNNFGEIFFRVNLYENRNRKPYQRMLDEEIIVKTAMKKGTLSVDLSRYNLVVEKDFFLSLEWVKALNEGKITEDLKFCAGLGKGLIYTKSTSQANWKEFTQKKYGFRPLLGFYVEAAAME